MGADADILPAKDADELVDFTCASPWERLALDIELELRAWGLHDGQQPEDEIHSDKNNVSRHNSSTSILNPNPRTCSLVSIAQKSLLLQLRSTPPGHSLDAHPLERLLGVTKCVLLTADTPDGIAADDGSDAAVLLSAMAVAASACSCSIPMIVSVGRPSSMRFIGRQLHPRHLRFSCDYTHQISADYTHLAGLLNLFRNKRTAAKRLAPPPMNDAIITAKFMYDWSDFSFKLAPIPGSFASDRRLSAVQTEAIAEADPIRRIQVTAIWDEFPATALQHNAVLTGMPASTASRLRLSPPSDLLEAVVSSQIPSPRIPLTGPALALLHLAQIASNVSGSSNPAAPLPVVDVRKRSSLSDPQTVDVMTSDVGEAGALSSPRIARSPGPSALDGFLTQVAEYTAAAAVHDDQIDEQFVASAVATLFEMNLGRGIMADVVDALGPNAAETTVLERLSRLIAASEAINGAQKLWNLFLDGVEVHWEHEWIICGVPFSAENGPDHDASLVTQKLQMLNCCVERRRREATDVVAPLGEDPKDGQGRKTLLEGVVLVGENYSVSANVKSGSTSVWEPYVQPHPLMTRDMVEEELQRMVLRAESNEGNDELEARRQSQTLKSDMMAFKAANPTASMADFVRWFSPADWVAKDDAEGDGAGDIGEGDRRSNSHLQVQQDREAMASRSEEKTMSRRQLEKSGGSAVMPASTLPGISGKGRLSARMSRKGNIWEELWKEAEKLPASQQVPLFDAAAHGSKALADLRAMPMTQVFLHLAIIQGTSAASLLQHAFSRGPTLPSVRHQIDTAKSVMRGLSSTLTLIHADAVQLGHVAEAIDKVASAEHTALIATSVFAKLPPVEGLAHVIDNLACGKTADVVEEREMELITRMAGLGDGGWRSVLLPEQREFVIHSERDHDDGKGMTDRMYARLSRDEFRVAFRLGLDYSV